MATLRAVDVRAPEGGLAREESSSGEASPLSVLPPTDAFDELNLTRPGVSWCRYSTDAYVQLPAFVKPLLHMAHLHKILVVGLPSMSPSVGLAGFRDLVPKKIRKACPFTCVIDFPGREERGFVEVPNFVEVFTMDVTPYTGEKDFLKKALRANARRCVREIVDVVVEWSIASAPVPRAPNARGSISAGARGRSRPGRWGQGVGGRTWGRCGD